MYYVHKSTLLLQIFVCYFAFLSLYIVLKILQHTWVLAYVNLFIFSTWLIHMMRYSKYDKNYKLKIQIWKTERKNSKWTFQHTRSDFFSLDVFPPSGNFCHVDKDTFLNIDFFGGCRNSEIRSISQKNLYTKIDFTLNIARIICKMRWKEIDEIWISLL